MRIVVAVDERLDETPLARVPMLAPVREATVLLVHVVDTGGREEWEHGAGRRLLGRAARPSEGHPRMVEADRVAGERVLSMALAETEAWGAQVRTSLRQGSPKHELRALLEEEAADLLVVFVRGREVGPKSIHKEARFLIDHAPCPVLVVKG